MTAQPEAGKRWQDYVPRWLKVGATIAAAVVTILVGVFGFAAGLGEGRGVVTTKVKQAEARLDKLEAHRESDRASVDDIRVHLRVMSANVTAIAKRLGVPVVSPGDDAEELSP